MTPKKIINNLFSRNLIFNLTLIRNRIKYANLLKKTHLHYDEVLNNIKKDKKHKLRFFSYVVFDSCFAANEIVKYFNNFPEKYETKIVIIPDVSRGYEHMLELYDKTKKYFVTKIGKEFVLDGYDKIKNEYLDYSDDCDIIYLSNPYDMMVNKIHGIHYLSKKNVLPIYMSYGCMPDIYGCKVIMPLLEISLFWKVFADNQMSYSDYCKYELLKGKNVFLSGYSKMDSLFLFKERNRTKKRVIIAAHHTINNPQFPLSNFLKYFDFILALPKIFPEVDFVFRPHPLLFTNLINEGFWSKQQVNEYIEKLKSLGIEYSSSGDYLDLFTNSDAIIHDCSSFIVEYLYTNKPCCFVAKKNYKKIFSTLGKACLENYYLAFNEKQIEAFIRDVVITDRDMLKEKRIQFAKEKLALNYPYVSKKIIEEIGIK